MLSAVEGITDMVAGKPVLCLPGGKSQPQHRGLSSEARRPTFMAHADMVVRLLSFSHRGTTPSPTDGRVNGEED